MAVKATYSRHREGTKYKPHYEITCSGYAKTKMQFPPLHLCFHSVESTIPNSKFQASSPSLWLHSPGCLRPS